MTNAEDEIEEQRIKASLARTLEMSIVGDLAFEAAYKRASEADAAGEPVTPEMLREAVVAHLLKYITPELPSIEVTYDKDNPRRLHVWVGCSEREEEGRA